MAHLAPRPRLQLAVEMQAEVGLGEDVAPFLRVLADQVVHFYPAAAHRRAQRPARDRANMLLELRGLSALDRPMPGIVHARRDLVDDEALGAPWPARHEQFDADDPDIVEPIEYARGDRLRILLDARADARGDPGARENMPLVLVLA